MEGDLGGDMPTGREADWLEAVIAAAALLVVVAAFCLGLHLGRC